GLMRHRYELVNEATQRKNKLIAICDELFPEFTQVFKDPNAPLALDLREQFPTPSAIAAASSVELRMVRRRNDPTARTIPSGPATGGGEYWDERRCPTAQPDFRAGFVNSRTSTPAKSSRTARRRNWPDR